MAEKVGECKCPICAEPGAELKTDTKGHHYINCDECGSLIRSMGRKGRRILAGFAEHKEGGGAEVAESPPPPPSPKTAAPAPAPKPTPKAPISWLTPPRL